MKILHKISGNHIINSQELISIYNAVIFHSVGWYNRYKMDLKESVNIVVMRKSLMFLRMCFLFPSEKEIASPEKNVFIKFTILNILASFYPAGVFLHMVINIESKSSVIFCTILSFNLLTYYVIFLNKHKVNTNDNLTTLLCSVKYLHSNELTPGYPYEMVLEIFRELNSRIF